MDRRATTTIIIVTGAAAALVLFLLLRSAIEQSRSTVDPQASPPAQKEVSSPRMTITAKHAFRDGRHIVVGEYELPTPCHILETTATVTPDGRTATIDFISSIKTGDVCAQMITPTRFRVDISAPEDVRIDARNNGTPAILNLIEAGPNEDLENIPLYIKG